MGLGRYKKSVAGVMLTLAAASSAIAVTTTPLGSGQIYSCTDANGKKLTSDRPIPECANIPQRELNRDGSVKGILPPQPTADERAAKEALDHEAIVEDKRRQEAIRNDRNLLMRFPNAAAHQKKREAALDDARKSMHASEARVAQLTKERKPMLDEAEFYAGKTLPIKLKNQLDSNEVSTDAQRMLIQNQQAEVVRINQLYDAQLDRLKKLWAGAQPGSLGTLTAPVDTPPAAAAPMASSASAAAPRK